ncbi:GMC family oxidoreductase [Mesorhizobium sp. M4A.F.Ca.ET.022.05.2.1]|uniref:GMC oxidoreductase n=1 Tax=Mesorhizobium sp. M4A.F.Ca.ET.022.05.2.1 TaxID=2496653 RepID=UPI000FCC956C|nr:GMC family oxidoreductase [Mesorhizobium sp. M4A.F.Ca.ET.022.05.2.1]RVC82009.1 GMC family oxidoreductase [Mesorhizobium sp. M4A.F.Ca.ET.022.05.2.1]
MKDYDAIIVGSGVGGGVVARRLSEKGARVLMLERGDFVPRETDNWSVDAVFFRKKYKAKDTWFDKRGKPFDPGMYYNVGGSTKFYGGAMFRLRERDFEAIEHRRGVSPAWPYRYGDLAPYYDQAERIFRVHGDDRFDRTSPRGAAPFPYAAVRSEPAVEKMAESFRSHGLSPSSLPLAVNSGAAGSCILCNTCDGFPCKIAQKNDAETCGVEPALKTGRVDLMTRAFARRLLLTPDGKRISRIEIEHAGERKQLSAPLFVVSCNAVNSAALLLRSADSAAVAGVANRSGVVGRHYMVHNQTALMALSHRINETVFQKTLAINDWYFGDEAFRWPMGQMQMLGKLQGGMLTANVPYLPRALGDRMARHGMDWIGLSEDLPDPDNRVTIVDGQIKLAVTLNNLDGHRELVRRMKKALRGAGYPIVVTKSLVKHATGHQCGTVRMGDDPGSSALDPYCRAWDQQNLFVVDASFFPSSAAVNPALTIAAQALRAADHILATDLA